MHSRLVGERLKKLRNQNNLSQQALADRLGINRSTYSRYESGVIQADYETLQKIADFYGVSVDYLLGRTDDPTPPDKKSKPYYALTEKDERDIAKDLERLMQNLESDDALAFYGEPLDEQTKELLRISLENSMRLAKQIAKQKFTPKKHRNKDSNGDS